MEDALRAIGADLKAAKSAISALGFRAHLPTAKGGENVKLLVEGNGQTQGRLIDELPLSLTSRHREFLLSVVSAEPAWDLMPFANLQHLPAPQWKLINLRKLKMRDSGRFSAQREELASRFANLPKPVGSVP